MQGEFGVGWLAMHSSKRPLFFFGRLPMNAVVLDFLEESVKLQEDVNSAAEHVGIERCDKTERILIFIERCK